MTGRSIRRIPVSASDVQAVAAGTPTVLTHQGQVIGIVVRFSGDVQFPRGSTDGEAARIWAESEAGES